MVVRASCVAVECNLRTKCGSGLGTVSPSFDDIVVWQNPARLRGTRCHPMARSSKVLLALEGIRPFFELNLSIIALSIDARAAQFQLA